MNQSSSMTAKVLSILERPKNLSVVWWFNMARASKSGKMGRSTMAAGKTVKCTALAKKRIWKRDINTKANGSMA